MRILSYVVRYDAGFAPNPFGGYLTLATCKPEIRKHARVGDLLVGTGSAMSVGADRLIYAAKVSSVVPLEEYGSRPDYVAKVPSNIGEPWQRYGDNYYVMHDDGWHQRPNYHHSTEATVKDVSGKNALVCNAFWYFGRSAPVLQEPFHALIKKGPGHKVIDEARLIDQFWVWLCRHTRGVQGQPCLPLAEAVGDLPLLPETACHGERSSRSICEQRARIPKEIC